MSMIFDKIWEGWDDSQDQDIIGALSESFSEVTSTNSVINSYMVESSTLIHESSNVSFLKTMFDKFMTFIRNLYEKFMALVTNKNKTMEKLLERYRDELVNITNDMIKSVVYEYKVYDIKKNIPVFGYIDAAAKYMNTLSNGNVRSSDLENMKDTIDTELNYIRGKILGMDAEITQPEFIGVVRQQFRVNDGEVYMKHLTRDDLIKMLESIRDHEVNDKLIQADKDKLLNDFKKMSDNLAKFADITINKEGNGGVVKGTANHMDIISLNIHKQYQSTAVYFLTQISDAYSTVFKEKITAMKDKFEMEHSIVRQVIYLLQ